MIRDGGVARVEDLRKTLKVSVATIRRDLEILEEEGKFDGYGVRYPPRVV